MSSGKRLHVAILFGGQSTEHEISCLSAYSVIKNIDRDKFDPIMIGITRDGEWVPFYGKPEEVKNGEWEHDAVRDGKMTSGIVTLETCDVIFPVLHGLWGEDGTVQGVFELLKKPYVGCNVLSSAVAMDKTFTKIVLDSAGIPQAKYVIATRYEIQNDIEKLVSKVRENLGFPCFVKPSNSGSSVGASKAENEEKLIDALNDAQKYDRKVLVEEYINAREIECAVLGNEDAVASHPGEIIPSKEFYDFEDKYKTGTSVIQIPADISEDETELIRDYAVRAFKAIDGSGLARVDFFKNRDTGKIILNEINTLPGFTDISMYAKMWKYEGIEFKELVTKLIELAYDAKQSNARINKTNETVR